MFTFGNQGLVFEPSFPIGLLNSYVVRIQMEARRSMNYERFSVEKGRNKRR